jgi:mono/diheme cytochrome c family protein
MTELDASEQSAPLDQYEQAGERQPATERVHGAIYREVQDPVDGREPVSIWLVMGMLTLALGTGWYFGRFDGNFNPRILDGPPPAVVHSAQGAGLAPTIDPVLLGKRLYANCVPCHQTDGRGIANQFPPLLGSEWVLGDPRVPTRILLHGLSGPVTVAGREYNSQMPGWGKLGDRDIAAILTYVRQAWGNNAPAVAEGMVAQARTETMGRTDPWSSSELQAVAAQPVRDRAAPSTTGSASPAAEPTPTREQGR